MKIFQFSRRPKFFHPLDLERPIPNKPPSPNDNQLIKTKHNPRMTVYFHKQTMEQQPHHACELTKSKHNQNKVT